MTTRTGLRPTIYVDERHTYDVVLSQDITMDWREGQGSIRITIPYDGQQVSGLSPNSSLPLGTITLLQPDATDSKDSLDITVSGGGNLTTYLKSGAATTWSATYTPGRPTDTLVTVEGQIFDGAGNEQEALINVLFERPETFVNDLYLHLKLWTPNLAARLRPKQRQELQELLLQQENQRQVLLPGIDDTALLARSMIGLANSEGGRILIGVNSRLQVIGVLKNKNTAIRQGALESALLKAALLCEPPISFSPPDELDHEDNSVIRILVPKSTGAIYTIDGIAYRRDGSVTTPVPNTPPHMSVNAPTVAVGDLQGVLSATSNDDVIVLDGSKGVDTLELGPMICGLINADRRDGLIIIRNVVSNTQTFPFNLLSQSGGAIEQVEKRVRQELQRIIPRLEPPRPTLSRIDDTAVVVLQVPRAPARIALYNEQGYEWSERALRPITIHEVFGRYLQRIGAGQSLPAKGGATRIAYAELNYPICPPKGLWVDRDVLADGEYLSSYDGQRQAMVWWDKPLITALERGAAIRGDVGLSCSLVAPLRHALMQIDSQGVISTTTSKLAGSVYIQFDDVVASGVAFRLTPDNTTPILKNAVIVKTTQIELRLEIVVKELFERRRHASLLSFRLPDLTLDEEQIAVIQQACADLGFRMVDSHILSGGHTAILKGLRNKDFYDITLLVGIRYEPTSISRELRYTRRIDSKNTNTGVLDIRLALLGAGKEVPDQIAQLHMQLQQLIRGRLQYLRAE